MKPTFKILLISPDNLARRVVSLALESPLVDVVFFEPSQCLFKYCMNNRVDLLLFLSTSPYFASMNIVGFLRDSCEKLPPIYVIASSHKPSAVLSLLECGVSQYMTFPINLSRLRRKVNSLVEGVGQC